MILGQEEMLRELRRPTSMATYVERDEGRQSRAFYEHGQMEGGRRYYEQVGLRREGEGVEFQEK